jgi:polysaccharide biosynthesis protein PslG
MFRTTATSHARSPVAITATLCAALAALALAAGGAEAKVPRTFFGAEGDTTAVEPTPQSDFNRMRSARLGTLRINFSWGAVEPTPGAPRNWSYYDTMVERAARARVGILAVLAGSPPWAADGSAYAPLTPAARASFRLFVRDVVQRYGHGGSFWKSHPGVPRRPIPAYQVWNEPNYPPHWSDGPSVARDYASLLKLIGRTIRVNDRRALIGTAGLLANSTRGPAGYRYLDDLYAVKGIRRYFDAVAIHPYSEDARGVRGELSRIRGVMRSRGDAKTPVWISELGWATGGGSEYFSTTPAGQARRLGSAFRFVVRNRDRYHVSKLVWFSWRDRAGPSSRGWEFYCGLFRLNGEPKPAWATFRSFTRATG